MYAYSNWVQLRSVLEITFDGRNTGSCSYVSSHQGDGWTVSLTDA